MMLGARNARMAVSRFLADAMPPRIAQYRNEWNYSASELPDPRRYYPYEPTAVDKWPSLITVVMGMGGLSVDDYSEHEPEYGVVYQMRTYVWARGEGAVRATDVRDDLTTVVRDLLIDNPRLQNSHHTNSYNCNYRVDDTSIREEYSDLTLLKGDRVACASFVAYDLRAQETPTRASIGTVGAAGIDLEVELMGWLPNAPTLLTAVATGTSVALDWKAPTWQGGRSGVTSYSLQQTTDGGTNWSTITGPTGNVTEHTVTGLTSGTTYQWRVAGITSEGTGAYSVASNAVTIS